MSKQALLDKAEQTSSAPRTKAEMAALQYMPFAANDQAWQNQGGADAGDAAQAAQAAQALTDFADIFNAAGGGSVRNALGENFIKSQAERVRDLGPEASVSQLIEARQHLLVGAKMG